MDLRDEGTATGCCSDELVFTLEAASDGGGVPCVLRLTLGSLSCESHMLIVNILTGSLSQVAYKSH